MNDYVYKRRDHFIKLLDSIDKKNEYRDKLPQLIRQIRNDLKRKYLSYSFKNIRNFLKNNGMSKYYENITIIYQALNRIKIPVISREKSGEIIDMFQKISDNWRIISINGRGFLPYSFAMRKLCELLDLRELIPYCPLLKSQEKQRHYISQWKRVCDVLDWQYIGLGHYTSALMIQKFYRKRFEKRSVAAKKIQKVWLGLYYDPASAVCKRRLIRELSVLLHV